MPRYFPCSVDFTEIHTPKIIASFYYDKEAWSMSFEKVFDSDQRTNKHLSEAISVDMELLCQGIIMFGL